MPTPDIFLPTEPRPTEPRPTERSARLDPLGVYGTRSARRRHQMQRRRNWQNGTLWAIGLGCLGALAWWFWQPHPTSSRSDWERELPFRPAAAPVAGADGTLWIASQSGGLWKVSPARLNEQNRLKPLFSTAFAPGAAPLAALNRVFWPGADGKLFALDAKSGAVRWQHDLPSTLVTRPALLRVESVPNRAPVVAQSNANGAPGTVAASGAVAAPTELLKRAARYEVAVGDDEGHIKAFDALDGTPLWQRELPGAAGEAVVSIEGARPAFLVPLLAGAASRGGLICLDARSGAPIWQFPTDQSSQSGGLAAPAVHNGRVFWCNDEGAVVCLDAASGRKIWKVFARAQNAAATGASEVAQAQNSASSGTSNATSSTATSSTATSSGAAPDASMVSSGNADKSAADTMISLRGAPTVVDEAKIVAVGGNDGVVRAFDLDSGAARWEFKLAGTARFAARPLDFDGQKALLCSGDGPVIFLLGARDGRVRRRWATPFPIDFGLVQSGAMALALDAEGHLQGATLR